MFESAPSFLGAIVVQYVDNLIAPDTKEPLMGMWDESTRTIKLHSGMHPQAELQVFWHEWIHAMLSDAGVRIPGEQEETVCDALGTALAVFALHTT